jgi:undecaprenyl-diphosphatase
MPKLAPGSIAPGVAMIDRRGRLAQHAAMARSTNPAGTDDRRAWRAWLAERTPELSAWRAWLAGRAPELSLLACLVVVAGGIWLFLGIAEEVHEGDLARLDRQILLLFRDPADPGQPLGPAWLQEAMRDLTALGSMVVLAIITLAAAVYLALAGKRRAALFLLVAIGGGIVIGFGLKALFERARPDLAAHAARVFTASFPSGHSMMAAVTYLTLGALLARIQPRRRLKLYLIGLAVLVSVAVGISRLYLGVHWPSDVLAGWVLGASWALLCWTVVLWLQRRGEIEQAGPEPPEPPESPEAMGAA